MKGSGIGGQAVMEGVMMKNGDKYAVAVRKPDGEIVAETKEYKSLGSRSGLNKIPIVRGVLAFIDSLKLGIGSLTYSASFFEEEDEKPVTEDEKAKKEKQEKVMMAGTVVLSVVLAVGIFMLLPYFSSISSWLCTYVCISLLDAYAQKRSPPISGSLRSLYATISAQISYTSVL